MSLLKSRFIEMFGDPIKNEKRWAQLTLNLVCDGIGDGLHGTPEYDDSGDFYFINGNNLINGEIVITPSTKKVNEEVFKKYYRNISSNALLLSINGTLGKIAFYNNEAITLGKSACYINLKTFVNKYFVFELMKTDHFLKYLEENSTKSTIKNVSLKTIRNFQLISPPENLQNDFISFSKKIDKSKFLLQQILKKLELLKKSRFIEMFIEKRYPTASLDELSICGGEYGAQSSAIEYHPNRPRYVRITDINEDGSLNNDYASSANIKDDEQYRLKYGDFLFARMGATVGKTYAYTFGDQIYAGYLIRYRLNLEKILPEYLFAFTRLNCYWKWVSINQNGAAQPGINAKKYGSLYVPVPPIEEQKKFIELSQQIDKSKLIIQKALEDLVGKV